MKVFVVISSILVGLFILIFLLGSVRTWQVQNNALQKVFLAGRASQPDGFYKGTVGSFQTPWQGKKFDAKKATGINVLKKGNKTIDKFPFKTYHGKGLQDKNLSVLKIDYSQSDPWWVRFVVDEIVETGPGKYLGKAHLTIIPGFPFTVGYFQLQK